MRRPTPPLAPEGCWRLPEVGTVGWAAWWPAARAGLVELLEVVVEVVEVHTGGLKDNDTGVLLCGEEQRMI